ncbi:ABC transporter ATP-binding protein [Nocardiopsis suaedae]|uniref:ABC transporter ATP-binding protein n=1 Tax=Nocardiopsis suaedae TaxID=3018444 RepID=A0ABT4TWG1_9ACTN|nr:ABC transporter ATP-binding protein [Nocardiopsis suaedae]MDA2808746.1 ABC transporter ATP-binding protein [Nocardiopsis suaedae]
MTQTAATSEESADPPAAAAVEDVRKIYGKGDSRVAALDGVSLAVPQGRLTAVMGPSGSGKSTLMHCMAGLDTVTSGRVLLGGTDLTGLTERALTRLRRDRVGFVFQAFNLVPTLTALENITLPADIAGRRPDRDWLDRVIDAVGLRDRLGHRPSELSGGQQQRVACARALAARPDIVFADEPTGNLDTASGRDVLGLLRDAAHLHGQTTVMVTHDPSAASYADLVVFLADGRVAGHLADPDADTILERMKSAGSPA